MEMRCRCVLWKPGQCCRDNQTPAVSFLTNESALEFYRKQDTGECARIPHPVRYHIAEFDGRIPDFQREGYTRFKKGDIIILGLDHCWPVSAEYFSDNYTVLEPSGPDEGLAEIALPPLK